MPRLQSLDIGVASSSASEAIAPSAFEKLRAWFVALKNIGFVFIQKTVADDCPGLAAEMAYHLILSLTPFLLFLTALSGLAGGHRDVSDAAREFIFRFAPAPAVELIQSTFSAIIHGSSAGLTLFGFIGTLWSASGAAAIVVKGLHRAYGLSEKRFPFWYTPLLSVCVIVSLGLISMVSTYLLMFGNFISDVLNGYFHLSPPWDIWVDCFRWGIVLVGIRWGAKVTYTIALKPRFGYLPWRLTGFGAWFFVFAWLLGSWAFSWYIGHLNQFNPVYGSLGVLIILVTWFYYSALAFFMGAELNALSAERFEMPGVNK
jgi:membrane protein